MTSKKVVELFYDVVSPYSWLGFEVMCRYRNLWNIDLKLRPALLGGVMQGSDNKPPAMVQNKFLYMDKDLRRLAGYFDVPLQPPSGPFLYPFGDSDKSPGTLPVFSDRVGPTELKDQTSPQEET